jgi:Na+/alanine symporter
LEVSFDTNKITHSIEHKAVRKPIRKERRGHWMTGNSIPPPSGKKSALLAIVVGGLLAGTLDLMQACILFGWRTPLGVAAGLLGRQAFHGGVGTYILGVLLHFFIACSAAGIYYAASRPLVFLAEHPLVCGLFFGVAVQEVMNLIVLPLSALHARGPYKLHDLILGLLAHMVLVGLPISFSVRRFAG